jgi:multiple sugar transport system substrate-binding protein
MSFLSRPEQQARFYRLTGDLPANVAAWGDSAIAADPYIAAFGEQMTRVAPWPKVPEWEPIAIRLQDWAERAVRGSVKPADALASMDREVDRMLEKRRWLVERKRVAAAAGAAGGAKP